MIISGDEIGSDIKDLNDKSATHSCVSSQHPASQCQRATSVLLMQGVKAKIEKFHLWRSVWMHGNGNKTVQKLSQVSAIAAYGL